MARHSRYQYLPLLQHDSIRLIELQPSQDKSAPIRCTFMHTTLSQMESGIVDHYTALSYVWGDASVTTDILVGELEHRLQVTASLECALRHIRDAKRTFFIWADGACINQNDIEERNRQVRQMGEIYSLATHTLIFLGDDETIAEGLVNLLNPRTADRDFESVHAALEVLRSHWFYRVWIYQELVMSRDPKVQYGQARCSWEDFCRMLQSLEFSSTIYKTSAAQLQRLADSSEIVLHMRNDRRSYQRALLDNMRWYEMDRFGAFQKFTDTLAARRGFGKSHFLRADLYCFFIQ